jgi:hypothetical protein
MNWEILFKLGLTVVFTVVWLVGVRWVWTSHLACFIHERAR